MLPNEDCKPVHSSTIQVTQTDTGNMVKRAIIGGILGGGIGAVIGGATTKTKTTTEDNIYAGVLNQPLYELRIKFDDIIGKGTGDSWSKIARSFTCDYKSETVIQSKVSSTETNLFYFNNKQLYMIKRMCIVKKSQPLNKTDYLYPIQAFNALYLHYKETYGEPVKDDFSLLETDESSILRYGGYIYSGSMSIESIFANDARIATLMIGPYSGGIGFTITEILEGK